MVKLKVTLGIGFARARQEEVLEIDQDEWDACESDDEREELIDDYAKEWAWNYIDIGATVINQE